jgi:hypothetical protein
MFGWEKNNISFTLNLREICTKNLYTEKNGTGATLKWKRENYILICGREAGKRDLLRCCGKSLFLFRDGEI